MNLLIYRSTTFPSQDLIIPNCRNSKRICNQNKTKTMSIAMLKQLEREGYKFSYKFIEKEWRNGQVSPFITDKVKNVEHFSEEE